MTNGSGWYNNNNDNDIDDDNDDKSRQTRCNIIREMDVHFNVS